MKSYPDLYDESQSLECLDIKESVLPPSVASVLRSVQSLGYATLIIYNDDEKTFRFAAVKVEDA